MYKDHRYSTLGLGPKVVAIGGGTGLSFLLRGLKNYTQNITAVVTVADDGGNSGDLREDLGMLPPGDIRACVLALANTEPTMEYLFNHRFKDGKLKNQNVGNLLIAALSEIYGSFERAIEEISNVLAVTGRVLPVTLEDIKIYGILENKSIVKGESQIPLKVLEYNSPIERIQIEPKDASTTNEVILALEDADLIVLGPGSLYTSIVPNLLIKDMVDYIYAAKAPKVYISNVMTQPGETDNYGVIDHIEGILRHSRQDFLDYIIINSGSISTDYLDIYRQDGSKKVTYQAEDIDIIKSMGIVPILGPVALVEKDYIKHDSIGVSGILMDIIAGKYRHN